MTVQSPSPHPALSVITALIHGCQNINPIFQMPCHICFWWKSARAPPPPQAVPAPRVLNPHTLEPTGFEDPWVILLTHQLCARTWCLHHSAPGLEQKPLSPPTPPSCRFQQLQHPAQKRCVRFHIGIHLPQTLRLPWLSQISPGGSRALSCSLPPLQG